MYDICQTPSSIILEIKSCLNLILFLLIMFRAFILILCASLLRANECSSVRI